MLWIETGNLNDTGRRYKRMWGTVWTETPDGSLHGKVRGEGLYEGEQFWADAIKETRHEPHLRLAMAKRNLPLPAAFRELAIATRAIIREKRKAAASFEDWLQELHWYAAIQSLAWYDDLNITPFAEIEALDLSPSTLGWEALPLLNKTDCKLMSEIWPNPEIHTTGKALYPDIQRNAAAALRANREQELADLLASFDDPPEPEKTNSAKAYGWFGRLVQKIASI